MEGIILDNKTDNKMYILIELIKSLAEYNNIEGYNNQKKFSIDITRFRNDSNCVVNVTRGTNDPKNIFKMVFTNEEAEDALLFIGEILLNNEYYSHISYTKNGNGTPILFNIHLLNEVVIRVSINSDEELRYFYNLEKKYGNKEIIYNVNKDFDKTKDELQEEKALKIINLFKKIMNILKEYNRSNNVESYKLVISNKYNNNTECYDYTFSIVKGGLFKEEFLKLNANIKNNNFMYDKIYELLLSLKFDTDYIYDSIQNEEKYIIDMDNSTSYEIVFSNNFDKLFYRGFQDATDHSLKTKNSVVKKLLKNN